MDFLRHGDRDTLAGACTIAADGDWVVDCSAC
jgi:hypothetical protein